MQLVKTKTLIYSASHLRHVVVQLPSCVWLFPVPWTASHQVSLSITISWSLPKFMFNESVTPSNHLILWHPLLLLPSVFLSIRVFTNESALYCSSASTSVLPKNIQGWFPLSLTGLISLLFKGLSKVFFRTTVWKHQFFGTLPYCSALTSIHDHWKDHSFDHTDFCWQSDVLAF